MTRDGLGRHRARPWRTVRFRVTTLALAAMTALLTAASLTLLLSVRSDLTERLDDDLTERLEMLAAEASAGRLPEMLPSAGDDSWIQAVDADGNIVARSADPDPDDLPTFVTPGRTDSTERDPDDDLDIAWDTTTIDDDPVRVATTTTDTPNGPVTIGIATSAVDLESTVGSLGTALALVGPVVGLVFAATTWVLVGRTLRPVDDIRRAVADIGSGDLAQRVNEPGTGDEVDRLARTMNEMLARLDEGARREREFVSDASHELRSPLTRMRVGLEVDRDHPEVADPDATRSRMLTEVVGMQRLVDELLQLARLDGGSDGRHRRMLDLDDIVLSEVASVRSTTDVTIDVSDVGAAQLHADPGSLTRVVRNLLDNAVRHARSRVGVSLHERAGLVELVVGDDGPGVPVGERERVFDRFTRVDEARSADGGAGLGLAITRTIVTQHNGTVVIGDSALGGAKFRVTLPVSAPP